MNKGNSNEDTNSIIDYISKMLRGLFELVVIEVIIFGILWVLYLIFIGITG